MLHKISFILTTFVASMTLLCVFFPEWIFLKVYESGALKPMTAGLFYSCDVGNGSLRWVNCKRGPYLDMAWYSLVEALYIIAIILLVASVPIHYKSMKSKAVSSSSKGRSFRYRAAPTTLSFIALGFQVVTIGIYGDHYESQSWCILRYADGQRTVCTPIMNYPGEAINIGWTYWIAVVTTVVAAINTVIDYIILNDEVEMS